MIPTGEYFTAAEVTRASGGEIPDAYAANAENMVDLLDQLRYAGGSRLRLTSLYRSPEHNAAVGGAGSSPHLVAAAADVVPLDVGVARWALAVWQAFGPGFGQLIIYPHTDGHAHVTLSGFPNGSHGKVFVLVGNPNRLASWRPGDPLPAWGSGSITVANAPADEGGVPVTWLPWLALGALLVLGLLLRYWS